MQKRVYKVALASLLTLGIALPTAALAENAGKGNGNGQKAGVKQESRARASLDKGKAKVEQAVKVTGNQVEKAQRVAGEKARAFQENAGRDMRAVSENAREAGREIRQEARELKNKAFNNAGKKDGRVEAENRGRSEFGQGRSETRANDNAAFRNNEHDRRFENRDERELSEGVTERTVYVRGVPADKSDLILIDVRPDNRDYILDLYSQYRQENDGWFNLFDNGLPFGIRKNLEAGKPIPKGLYEKVSFLPLSVNTRLGLPSNDMYRVGVLGDQLVLIETDRLLVLDVLRFDEDGNLIATDINVPDARLLTVRFDDESRAYLRTYLEAHPSAYDHELTWFERFREGILTPIGLGPRVMIGEPVPSSLEVNYLPTTLNAQLDLPGTDLRVGLIGDDLVLVDTQTALVLDVIPDIV